MAPVTDERAIRAAFSDLTSHQPPASDRLEAVRKRLMRRRRRRITGGAICALTVALVLAGVSQLPVVHGQQPQARQAPTGPAASPTAPVSGRPVNLVASEPVKAALTAAFIRYEGMSAQDVAGTVPGSVYYAYAPSMRLDWALARFKPSMSAPLKVRAKFQDGANFAILAQPPGSNWLVVNIVGEPACLRSAGLPAAVERAWNLTDSPGCAPVSSAVTLDNAVRYRASFEVPANWSITPYRGGVSFDRDGSNGFVNVVAAASADTIQATCSQIANDNVLHPYGTAPAISVAVIDGHPACFIAPSADALPQRVRGGGPQFTDSSVVVRYRVLLSNTYRYLLITCDPGHLWSIAESIQLAPGY